MSDYLSDVFGDGGIFASRFPGYEARPGQVALARMVDEAMSSGHHALGEGPCGTGKGVAYCVPAIHQAVKHGKRVVIATANIALQEQLVSKDLPTLKEVLPWDFEFALLKGRNNFVCLDRLREAEARGELTMGYGDEVEQQLQHILGWERETETGDKSELPFVPKVQAWSKASVGSEECKRDGCRFFDDCYAERAKAIAAEADIVVTNFHMLFAHLAIRGETGRDLVLPPFDFLVLDEAHEAADVAREFFGFTISRFTITRLAQVAAEVELPAGVRIQWTGQFRYLQRAEERLRVVLPLTLLLVFFLLYLNTRSVTETAIVLLAVPFSLIGAFWLLYWLGFHLSVAVWVGIIALAGLDAETGVIMLLYLRLAEDRAREQGRLNSMVDLTDAIVEGAAGRVRPKLMTVMTTMLGLAPLLWSTGAGADVMQRIAAPMVGGLVSSFFLELTVYPAIFAIWKSRKLDHTTPRIGEGEIP